MSRKSRLNMIYYLACGACGASLASVGLELTDWQYWVCLTCLVVSYIVGREIND